MLFIDNQKAISVNAQCKSNYRFICYLNCYCASKWFLVIQLAGILYDFLVVY